MSGAACPHPNPLSQAGEGAGRDWDARVLLPCPSGESGGVRGQRPIHSPQRGFSLLEILVAFAIAAMALGMLYGVSGNNARQAGVLTQHERAMVLAQSLLAAYQTVPPQGLNEAGEAAGYGWRVASRPYATPVDHAAPQAAHLHEILVDITWLDGSTARNFELTSLRPERRPPRGGGIR